MLYKNDKVNFEIVCDCQQCDNIRNESDDELKKHRADADETGYDADMEFRYWIDHSCVRVIYDLFGLEFEIFSIPRNKPGLLQRINIANEIILEWFKNLTIDDICEALYHKVECELGAKIFYRLNEYEGLLDKGIDWLMRTIKDGPSEEENERMYAAAERCYDVLSDPNA